MLVVYKTMSNKIGLPKLSDETEEVTFSVRNAAVIFDSSFEDHIERVVLTCLLSTASKL